MPHDIIEPCLRVVRGSDVVVDEEGVAACEAAYRRGVHQALAWAARVAVESDSLGELRRVLERYQAVSAAYRYERQEEGGPLLHLIEQEVERRPQRGRRPVGRQIRR